MQESIVQHKTSVYGRQTWIFMATAVKHTRMADSLGEDIPFWENIPKTCLYDENNYLKKN